MKEISKSSVFVVVAHTNILYVIYYFSCYAMCLLQGTPIPYHATTWLPEQLEMWAE